MKFQEWWGSPCAVECPPASDSEPFGAIFLAQASRCDAEPVVDFAVRFMLRCRWLVGSTNANPARVEVSGRVDHTHTFKLHRFHMGIWITG